MHGRWMAAFALLSCASGIVAAEEERSYRSPYQLKLSYPLEQLVGDLQGERGDPAYSSTTPQGEWYSGEVERRWNAWGPPVRHYPAPTLPRYDASFLRERVLAAALRFEGYHYQHHHLPDWNPPKSFSWKKVELGRNSKGVDCANFTAFVYNQSLGLKPTSDCDQQAEITNVPGPGEGKTSPVLRIDLPGGLLANLDKLRPADLVFMRGSTRDEITHVVLWVGELGVLRDSGPTESPLVLDSHGEGVRDFARANIPEGIYLRPVVAGRWYDQRASHALRLIPDDASGGKP